MHPIPLAATAVLFLNDHWLKGAEILPPIVTGKLSDFAGLLFFPLLCTAAFDTAVLGAARLGAPLDFSLRRFKLAVAALATGALFCAIKLSASAAGAVAGALSRLGIDSHIVADPWDLIALPCLWAAYVLGKREIARVPLGRLEAIERASERGPLDVAAWLEDAAVCGARREHVAALAEAYSAYLGGAGPDDAAGALAKLRNPA